MFKGVACRAAPRYWWVWWAAPGSLVLRCFRLARLCPLMNGGTRRALHRSAKGGIWLACLRLFALGVSVSVSGGYPTSRCF